MHRYMYRLLDSFSFRINRRSIVKRLVKDHEKYVLVFQPESNQFEEEEAIRQGGA